MPVSLCRLGPETQRASCLHMRKDFLKSLVVFLRSRLTRRNDFWSVLVNQHLSFIRLSRYSLYLGCEIIPNLTRKAALSACS